MAATWIFIMQSMRTAQATPEKQKLHNTSSYGGIGFLCPLFRGERDCSDIMINGNISPTIGLESILASIKYE